MPAQAQITISVIDRSLRFPQQPGVLTHDEILAELIRQIDAGVIKQADVARALAIPAPRVAEMRNGKRRIQQAEMPILVEVLGLIENAVIPVVGYVGGGAQVLPYDDYAHGDGMDFVKRPDYVKGRAVAVEVKGDSMLPVAENGWKLVYTDEQAVIEEDVLNRLCVVQLADGRMLVKKILRGSMPLRYHLHSSNAPLMEDMEIVWAARVKSIIPA